MDLNRIYLQRHPTVQWCQDLPESIWFHISQYLTISDIHRLSRTCSRLHTLLSSQHFWSYLIRQKFGQQIWKNFVQNSLSNFDDLDEKLLNFSYFICPAKSIYVQLIKRRRISLTDTEYCLFDHDRSYKNMSDPSSLTGYVLYIRDFLSPSYSLQIRIIFKHMLPGRYDVIWRMKLDFPYILGVTEFIAVVISQCIPASSTAYVRWTQDDFLSMYQCFHCESTKTNLWFYQNMGSLDIAGTRPCDVCVSMINEDDAHAKYGIFLDYVELKRRFD